MRKIIILFLCALLMLSCLLCVGCAQNNTDDNKSEGEAKLDFAIEKFKFEKLPYRVSTEEELVARVEEVIEKWGYAGTITLAIRHKGGFEKEAVADYLKCETLYTFEEIYGDDIFAKIKIEDIDFEGMKALSNLDVVTEIEIKRTMLAIDDTDG